MFLGAQTGACSTPAAADAYGEEHLPRSTRATAPAGDALGQEGRKWFTRSYILAASRTSRFQTDYSNHSEDTEVSLPSCRSDISSAAGTRADAEISAGGRSGRGQEEARIHLAVRAYRGSHSDTDSEHIWRWHWLCAASLAPRHRLTQRTDECGPGADGEGPSQHEHGRSHQGPSDVRRAAHGQGAPGIHHCRPATVRAKGGVQDHPSATADAGTVKWY